MNHDVDPNEDLETISFTGLEAAHQAPEDLVAHADDGSGWDREIEAEFEDSAIRSRVDLEVEWVDCRLA